MSRERGDLTKYGSAVSFPWRITAADRFHWGCRFFRPAFPPTAVTRIERMKNAGNPQCGFPARGAERDQRTSGD
jgi:hypothetical protein